MVEHKKNRILSTILSVDFYRNDSHLFQKINLVWYEEIVKSNENIFHILEMLSNFKTSIQPLTGSHSIDA